MGSDKSNRNVTFAARSGSVTQQTTFQVTGTKISSSYTTTVLPGSTGNPIVYLLTDVNSVGLSGQTITIDAAYVDGRLKDLALSEDLARYVL